MAQHGQLPAVKVAGLDLTRPRVDGGRVDGGKVDAGRVDAGRVDAGRVDAGPDRPVLVVRLDATLIDADSDKDGAAGNYKGGFGFHPLTAFCSNVGDSLAVMLRPGNAGDTLAGWPPDQRIIVRRVPRPAGDQPKLGESPDWRYGAFTTNTPLARPNGSTPGTAPRPTSKTR